MDASDIEAAWLDAADLRQEIIADRALRRESPDLWQEKVHRATERANQLYEMWADARAPADAQREVDDIVNRVKDF